MMLLIDAGNTRVKWALAAPDAGPGQWLASGAVALAQLSLLSATWASSGASGALVSNVAGDAVREQIRRALPATMVLEWFSATPQRAGLVNGYEAPERLGCDRFAAAIGARTLYPQQNLVVATCGTATTIDAVSADGRFMGGMILPGLTLMHASLARNTAQLPQVANSAQPPALFATNTTDAIRSGCLSAQAGAIERACASFEAARCILAGGAAPAIAPVLRVAHDYVDALVLIGLQAVSRSQGGAKSC